MRSREYSSSLDWFFASWVAGAANFAGGAVASPGGAVFAAVVDDLQVEPAPGAGWKEAFEVLFGLNNVFA